jgi:hypothetical protein
VDDGNGCATRAGRAGTFVRFAALNVGVVEYPGTAELPVKLPNTELAGTVDRTNVGVVVGVVVVNRGDRPETLVTAPPPPVGGLTI